MAKNQAGWQILTEMTFGYENCIRRKYDEWQNYNSCIYCVWSIIILAARYIMDYFHCQNAINRFINGAALDKLVHPGKLS